MKRLMFKIISTLLVFFLVLTVGKKILVVQANKMGGDFNKAVEYIKKGEYIDAVMAFTGDLSGIATIFFIRRRKMGCTGKGRYIR